MSALGPVARSLVATARAELGPDPGAAARVRAKVAAAVAPAPGAAVAAKAAGAGGRLAGHAVTAKLAAVMFVVGAAVGGTWVARHGGTRATAPAARRTTAVTSRAPSSSTAAPMAPLAAVPPNDTSAAAPSSDASPAAAPPSHAAPARTGAPHVAPPPSAPSLAREVELVDRAQAALHAGAYAEAIAAVAVFDRETAGHGQLAEDAAAIDLEARCRRHEAGVAARLAAFDARWPRSAQRPRLAAACPQP